MAQTPKIINYWFKLYLELKARFEVDDDDVYNFDKKGVMIGVTGKVRILVDKTEKNPYTTQAGNREWVTSTECCSLTGRKLTSQTIFKGKID